MRANTRLQYTALRLQTHRVPCRRTLDSAQGVEQTPQGPVLQVFPGGKVCAVVMLCRGVEGRFEGLTLTRDRATCSVGQE